MSELVDCVKRHRHFIRIVVTRLIDWPILEDADDVVFAQRLAVILGIVLVPLRGLLCFFFYFATTLPAYLAVLNLSPKDLEEPISGWRLKLKMVLKFFARCLLFFVGFHHIRVKGKQAPTSEAPIAVFAPHTSFLDSVMITAFASDCTIVSRKENESIFLLKGILKLFQPIMVERSASDSKQAATKSVLARVKSGKPWPQLLLSPEGSCTNNKCLLLFKAGAFTPGLPVQPITVRYFCNVECTTWSFFGQSVMVGFLLILSQLSNSAEIEFHPPYIPSAEEKENPMLFAENVQKMFSKVLGIPATTYSYEDALLMITAEKLGLPKVIGRINFLKVKLSTGFNINTVKDHLRRFAGYDSNRDGLVAYSDILRSLNMDHSKEGASILARFFKKKDVLTFKEYLLGLSKLLNHCADRNLASKMAEGVFHESNSIGVQALCQQLTKHFGILTQEKAASLVQHLHPRDSPIINRDDFSNLLEQNPELLVLLEGCHTASGDY